MRHDWALLLLLMCAGLFGCAQAPLAPPPEPLLLDQAFAAPSERISADDVFALSDDMRRYVDSEMAAQLRSRGRQDALLSALRARGELELRYDSSTTRNAAQAFAARSGNCLSLVIMTAAFAKALDLRVTFQSAFADESWSRSGDLYFRSGHVNLTLGPRLIDTGGRHDTRLLTVDFLPAEEIRGLRTWPIGEQTVVAMYMNNRAAEALAGGRLDDAYGWARAAILQDRLFLSAYNTLGVIYLRHGDRLAAERVFAQVLEREPTNAQALSNRAQVLEQLGRADEAGALRRRLLQVEPYPPYHFFDLGRAAMENGDHRAARDLFAKEVDRADYNAEFQFWLGLAYFRLGDVDAARKHLGLAVQNSTTRGDRDLYAAKLGWLRGYRRQ